MPTRYQVGTVGSHGLGTTDRTRSNMPTRYQVGLQALTGSEQQILHAYEVSRRSCRISRVWNNRFNMPTRYSGWGCRISRVWNNRSNMLTINRTCPRGIRTGLQDLTCLEQQIQYAYDVLRMGAAGSHGFGTTDPTCLRGIMTGLQDLTGKEHQIVHAYELSGWAA